MSVSPEVPTSAHNSLLSYLSGSTQCRTDTKTTLQYHHLPFAAQSGIPQPVCRASLSFSLFPRRRQQVSRYRYAVPSRAKFLFKSRLNSWTGHSLDRSLAWCRCYGNVPVSTLALALGRVLHGQSFLNEYITRQNHKGLAYVTESSAIKLF